MNISARSCYQIIREIFHLFLNYVDYSKLFLYFKDNLIFVTYTVNLFNQRYAIGIESLASSRLFLPSFLFLFVSFDTLEEVKGAR